MIVKIKRSGMARSQQRKTTFMGTRNGLRSSGKARRFVSRAIAPVAKHDSLLQV